MHFILLFQIALIPQLHLHRLWLLPGWYQPQNLRSRWGSSSRWGAANSSETAISKRPKFDCYTIKITCIEHFSLLKWLKSNGNLLMLILAKIIWVIFVTEHLVKRRKRRSDVLSFPSQRYPQIRAKENRDEKVYISPSINGKSVFPKQMKNFIIFLELLLYSQK